MVIISALICDKAGVLFLSRQFQQISINELKERVRNFPKMIDANQQHTFIDVENTRYIYTPMDNLYLLLMTARNSNIIEDLEVIRSLKNIIQDICQIITEENIKKQSFEILLAIDDVISAGLRESTSTAQVHTALEMESSDEKLHMMLQRARENEAKELAKKHQQEVERRRQEELAKKHTKKQDAFTLPQVDSYGTLHQQLDSIPAPKKVEQEQQQEFNSIKSVLVTKQPRKGMQLGKKKDSEM